MGSLRAAEDKKGVKGDVKKSCEGKEGFNRAECLPRTTDSRKGDLLWKNKQHNGRLSVSRKHTRGAEPAPVVRERRLREKQTGQSAGASG